MYGQACVTVSGRLLHYYYLLQIYVVIVSPTLMQMCRGMVPRNHLSLHLNLCIDQYVLSPIHTGHPLSLKQEDVGIDGWAVECRVYAEVHVCSIPDNMLHGHIGPLIVTVPSLRTPLGSSPPPPPPPLIVTVPSLRTPLGSFLPDSNGTFSQDPIRVLPP